MVFGEAEACFVHEVEAGEVGVWVFEEVDDSEGLGVVFKAAIASEEFF